MRGATLATLFAALLLPTAACAGGARVNASATGEAKASAAKVCEATRVHYRSYKGVQKGLEVYPWISASPQAGLVGHLFYYPGQKVWQRKRLSKVRIYAGGQSPDGRMSMKILWEIRNQHVSEASMRVKGRRLDGKGSFSDILAGKGQFPSIIDIPTPGCWQLTLKGAGATGSVTMIAVAAK
ncbi:MAG: hypothetical protein ABSC36_06125 [Gaiellaceae bacterium]|jgi:hypothetical protein